MFGSILAGQRTGGRSRSWTAACQLLAKDWINVKPGQSTVNLQLPALIFIDVHGDENKRSIQPIAWARVNQLDGPWWQRREGGGGSLHMYLHAYEKLEHKTPVPSRYLDIKR